MDRRKSLQYPHFNSMKLNLCKKNNGFTLVELLVYFGILVLLLLIIGTILFNVIQSKTKLETVQETSQNARTVMELISDRVRNAQSVTSPAQGASGAGLTLVMADATKNPTIFSVSSGKLQIKEGSGATTTVSSDNVTISSILFSNVSYSGQPGSVRIQMTISSSDTTGRREYTNQETFYTTVTTRPK